MALQFCFGFCYTSTCESAIGIPMSSSSWTFLPPPTPLGCPRAPGLGSLCPAEHFHWLPSSRTVVKCCSLKSSHLFPPLLCPKVCFLCLPLHRAGGILNHLTTREVWEPALKEYAALPPSGPGQCFSDFKVYRNLLAASLKCRLWFSRYISQCSSKKENQ